MANLVKSSIQGIVYEVDDIDRLRRFLCFGSENGTYYIGKEELGQQNADCIKRLIEDKRGVEMVDELVSFSVEGRAAKQDSLLFAFAMCARLGDKATKRRAYDALDKVCRIPTHLFQFIELCEQLSVGSGRGSGWGRAHRNAIRRWYLRFQDNPLRLAQHVTKYQKRKGWSHVDVLRLSHPKPRSDSVNAVLRYVTKGLPAAVQAFPNQRETSVEMVTTLSFLKAVEEVKRLGNNPDDVQQVCEAIRRHNLVREHVPTQLLNSIDVWKALLINMPLNAMIRNLGKMTSMDMLGTGSEGAALVVEKLHNDKALRYARIHPFNVLLSMLTYKQGHGELSTLKWQANRDIVQALDEAFYLSFKYVEPTGKRYCLAVDVSGSMTWPVTGCQLINAREAAAALSMVTARSEEHCEVIGFSTKLVTINVTPQMSMPEVIKVIDRVPMGGTDCAAPMVWATQQKKKFDVFIVYTDSETRPYRVSPAQAMKDYRQQSGIPNAKLIVCAFASNGFTLADPNDPGMLDMAGFDSNGPAVMNTFVTSM